MGAAEVAVDEVVVEAVVVISTPDAIVSSGAVPWQALRHAPGQFLNIYSGFFSH